MAIHAQAQQKAATAPAPSLVFDTFTPPSCSPIGKPTGGCGPGERHRIRLVPVAEGVVRARHLAFLPAGGLLIAEMGGNLRIARNGTVDPQPIAGWPDPSFQVRELASALVHPQFAQNQFVYLWYVKGRDDGMTSPALARGRLDGNRLTNVRDLFVADAWRLGGPVSGRAEFGPDGTIYMAVGDHDRYLNTANSTVRINAQNLGNHLGKVLRLRDDGTVPPDNPFVGRQDAKPEIYTYGHRTVTGFSWNRDTGELWEVEMGPMGGDELNILLPGRNYGWPLVSFGKIYNNGEPLSDQPYSRPGMENPRMFWVPTISPSGVMVYTGERFPWWKGQIFLGALNGQQLQRVAFKQAAAQWETRDSMLVALERRFRYVTQGPDGYIYVVTDQDYPDMPVGPPMVDMAALPPPGGGPPPAPSVVFRIEPAE